MLFPWGMWEVEEERVTGATVGMFGSYPTNLVPLGPSCSTGLTRLSPSLRAGSFLGRWSLLCPQDNETNIYTKHTLTMSVASLGTFRRFGIPYLCSLDGFAPNISGCKMATYFTGCVVTHQFMPALGTFGTCLGK